MNELAVVASETHEQAVADFKVSERYGYRFIMKVKKIRDERLYKELGFATFDDYCDSAWKTVRRSMDQKIQIAENFGNETDFENSYSQLGHSKSLMLARMEPEVRQQIESTVNVNETTVKQLSQLEKQLKETERERVRLENESVHYRQLLNQERSKPSQVVTKEIKVEVIPERVTKELEQLKFDNVNLKHGFQSTKEKLKQYELMNTVDFDAEQSRKQREKMQHEADFNTLELRVHITNFLEKAAISSFMQGAITASDPITKRKLQESINMLESFTTQIKAALNGRILGGIVNE